MRASSLPMNREASLAIRERHAAGTDLRIASSARSRHSSGWRATSCAADGSGNPAVDSVRHVASVATRAVRSAAEGDDRAALLSTWIRSAALRRGRLVRGRSPRP